MPTTPHPTRGVTLCTRCSAPIRWATWGSGPQRGRRVPLNSLPSPSGGLAAHTTGTGGLVVRELDQDRPDAELLEWKALAHWSSCSGNGQQQAPSSRPARRRPTVQPPLWGGQLGRR
ncbi:hypothetical protein JHN63_02070 [Streptomyces sp. MBT65]|uniref:hypothetical protein n=1 Tax=Streptomyces sp. MBT65 TaxID=1488395 RepID=UPI00190C4177|nr:hypothetical protein [Streptomyces sp. MBT65]MBK3572628.1 hypothetical protein [Streptomyces sp. MBT65]